MYSSQQHISAQKWSVCRHYSLPAFPLQLCHYFCILHNKLAPKLTATVKGNTLHFVLLRRRENVKFTLFTVNKNWWDLNPDCQRTFTLMCQIYASGIFPPFVANDYLKNLIRCWQCCVSRDQSLQAFIHLKHWWPRGEPNPGLLYF